MDVKRELKKLSVTEKLEIETLRRGANGALSQISLLVLMLIFTPTFPEAFWYRFSCILLISIFLFRWILFRKYADTPLRLAATNPWNLYLGVSTSFFWMIANILPVQHFGIHSFTGLMHLFLTNGLLAAVMYSLSPTPRLQRLYVLILGLPIAFSVILVEKHNDYHFIGWALILFVVYLLIASRNHSHDLRSAFEFEERLVKQNTKLQEIVDSIPGFMILFTSEGEWLQWSKSTDEVKTNSFLREQMVEFARSGAERKSFEVEIDTGDERNFVVTFEKLKLSDDSFIAIGLPVTEIKTMEKELEVQKLKAEYSSRLAAVGEMAGGVAHEINNPLSVISITSELLATRLQKAGIEEVQWKKHTDKIFETTNKIAKIIKSLQLLTREDVQDIRDGVDLNVIIQEAQDISTEKMKRKGIELTYESQGSVMVKARHVEAGQIILNLISNSYDAIPGEGKIQLKVETTSEEVFLFISDTGRGIPDNLLEKIFQPFFSTKEIGTGTGLGLPITKSILKRNDGDIDLVNAKAPTTFRLKFRRIV